jgi:Zn-dependent protease with chaperone function
VSAWAPRRIDCAPGGLGLWLAAAAIELLPALIRSVLVLVVGSALAFRFDMPEFAVNAAVLVLGPGPILWSAFALAGLEGGGGLARMRLGAREPSEREHQAIEDAYALFAGPVDAPRAVFVLDAPDRQAAVVGQTIYLHRELIGDPALPAVLAHELGHVNAFDGRLVLAARRFVLLAHVEEPGLIKGGISLRVLAPIWDAWMRGREFAADAYAARLGQGAELAAYLERERFFDVAVPFMSDRQHPYTEERIGRLIAAAESPGEREAA